MIDLPHNIEAEQAVLGGLMSDPTAVALIADWLAPDDFYRKDHGLIYQAIRELVDRNEQVDGVSVGEYFELNRIDGVIGGTSYVLGLHAMSTGSANIVAHAEVILTRSKLRRLYEVGNQLAVSAIARGADAERVAAASAAVLNEMNTVKPNAGLKPFSMALKKHGREMLRRSTECTSGLVGIATPWAALNELTKGLRPRTVYVVGARPSMGKTVFGAQIAAYAAMNNVASAFFSLEMGEDEIAGRIASCFAQVPHRWIDDPSGEEHRNNAEVYWERWFAWQKALSEMPLVIDDQTSLRIEQVKARARREHRKRELELLVLDHLHEMDFERGKGFEHRHELGRAIQGAKDLAKELNCAAVVLAQLNRANTGRSDQRPTMTDLRESGEIEQKADVILGLHREDYYDPNTHLRGVLEVLPLKGRNLQLGNKVHLQHRFDQMRIDDWQGAIPEAISQNAEPRRGGFRRNAA